MWTTITVIFGTRSTGFLWQQWISSCPRLKNSCGSQERKAKDINLPVYFLLHILEVGDEIIRAVLSDCAAITNYHRLGDLNNHLLTVCFVTVLKDRSPTSRCQPANLASCEGSLSGFQIATFLLCLHMAVNNSELSRISSVRP